jgi:hypothetical protein
VASAICSAVPGAIVQKNQVPKAWAMADIYCQLIPNDDEANINFDMMPRLYSFEVSYKGVVSQITNYSLLSFLACLFETALFDVAQLHRCC